MFNRNVLMFVAGAAIFALDAPAAAAQARPTSTRRIPVTKESPGEVTVRVDTLTVFKTDTLQMPGRTDTVVKTNTVTRVDTVTVIPKIITTASAFAGEPIFGSPSVQMGTVYPA